MNKKTGGPAFPEIGNVGYNSEWQSESGMTLRDFFAAKAMQSLVSLQDGSHPDGGSQQAYAWADAMIKAREASCE